MPRINFSTVEDAKTFTPIPEGRYLCEVNSIEQTTTSNGNEMWNLRLKILEGPCSGRCVFDRLVFTPAAMKRIKLVCARLGIDTSGELDLTPKMLRDRTAYVTVQIEDYVDDEGKERSRNRIPFDGYEAVDSGGSGERQPGDDGDEDDPL